MLRRNHRSHPFWNTLVDLDSLPWNNPDYAWNIDPTPCAGHLSLDEAIATEHVIEHHPWAFFPLSTDFAGLAVRCGVFASSEEYRDALAESPISATLALLAFLGSEDDEEVHAPAWCVGPHGRWD